MQKKSRSNLAKNLFLLLCLIFFSHTAAAWPLFTVPNNKDLEQTHYATVCENNKLQYQIAANAIIPAIFVSNLHPKNWQWTSSSQSPCFWIDQPLPIKRIEIIKNRDQDGVTLYSVINADFLAPDGTTFTLNLTTPREYWDCYLEKQAPNYIICANDI